MGIFDNLSKLTSGTNSDSMGQAVEEMVGSAIMRRRSHERRWYDNNFFDDGYHFRIISKKTGRVIDTVNKSSGYVERAIPRASRQIRGVSNLLFSSEPYPVVYPERISMSEFPKVQDPQTGQMVTSPEYEKAVEKAKDIAKKRGIWLSNQWEDEQHLNVKIIDAIIKAMKHSVSWIQVYSDTRKQKIITDVYDAFDIICYGDVDDVDKLPFITKTCSMELNEIKSSSLFDEAKVKNLTPDNKYATSEIKDAYMRARYGSKLGSDNQATSIVKETFLQEYLNTDNWEQAVKLSADSGAMEGKSKGDMIMRHIFSTGGITLNDEYIDYDKYPLAPVSLEPGPLYQVPFIERFIPQNKSLDVVVTRIEKFVNSMVVGVYQQRKGENMQVSNFPGGQKIEYETTPLTQMNVTSPGQSPFELINLLNKFIDEQGASTAALGQLPDGVKAGVAIESLKATEYANLKIPTLMIKKSIKRIAELMLERADKDFLKPLEVSHIQDGNPQYFDVIGNKGYKLHEQLGMLDKLPQDIVPLSKEVKVRIEIEPGLGLTMEGKKQAMQGIMDYMLKLYEQGFIAPEALQQVLKKFLEVFGYGSTEEFMEAMENGITAGQMSEQQIKQMQIAIAQTLKDVGAVGPQNDKKLVVASKIGTLESLKEAGLIKKMQEGGQPVEQKGPSESISFKDLPPEGKAQMAQQAGIHLSPDIIAQHDQQQSQQDMVVKQQEIALKQKALDQKGQVNGKTNSSPAN